MSSLSLELSGSRFRLYLRETRPHTGQGTVSCLREGGVKHFLFQTGQRIGLTVHGFALLPDFNQLKNGYTWEMVRGEIDTHGWPKPLVDAECSEILRGIREQEQDQLKTYGATHRVLIPTIIFERLSLSVLEVGFANKVAPVMSDE